jgi:hypothetical protein
MLSASYRNSSGLRRFPGNSKVSAHHSFHLFDTCGYCFWRSLRVRIAFNGVWGYVTWCIYEGRLISL